MSTKIKLALKARRIFQFEAAAKIGVSETRFSRIACGRIAPTDEEKKNLARLLRVPAEELFARSGEGQDGGQ